jgi:hypothetical protein
MIDFSKPLVPKESHDKKYWQTVIGRYDMLVDEVNLSREDALLLLCGEIGQYTPDSLKNYISKHRIIAKKQSKTNQNNLDNQN